jgi:hypothetical protein
VVGDILFVLSRLTSDYIVFSGITENLKDSNKKKNAGLVLTPTTK